MSTLLGTPDRIEYACECCRRQFAPPRSRSRLRFRDRLRILRSALWQTIRHFRGLRSGYLTMRPRLLARRNEETFERFVGSFSFCGECRGFICHKCWNGKAKLCKACVRFLRESRGAAKNGGVAVKATVAPGVATSVPTTNARPRRRPTFGLGPLFRPGRIRTVTSLLLLVFALLLGFAEATYVMAAPR
jgi:hypothetical protein